MRRKIQLRSETIRILSRAELGAAVGGAPDPSIVYNCPTNISQTVSCFADSCQPTGYYVCPMVPAG